MLFILGQERKMCQIDERFSILSVAATPVHDSRYGSFLCSNCPFVSSDVRESRNPGDSPPCPPESK